MFHGHHSPPLRGACADPRAPKWVLCPHGPQTDGVMAITGPVLAVRERRFQTEKQPAHVHTECLRGQMPRHALVTGPKVQLPKLRAALPSRPCRPGSFRNVPIPGGAAKPKGQGCPTLGSGAQRRTQNAGEAKGRSQSYPQATPNSQNEAVARSGDHVSPACLGQIPGLARTSTDEHVGEQQTPRGLPPPREPVFLKLFPTGLGLHTAGAGPYPSLKPPHPQPWVVHNRRQMANKSLQETHLIAFLKTIYLFRTEREQECEHESGEGPRGKQASH